MNSKRLDLLWLACLWGPTSVCMKILTHQIPPITLVASCTLFSLIALGCYLKSQATSLVAEWQQTWRQSLIMGFVGHALPFVLLSYSMYYMQSIWMGLLTSLVPIITALLAHWWLPNEKITPKRIGGVLLSAVGTCVLISSTARDPGSAQEFIGIMLALCSAISYAIGLVYARKSQGSAKPMVRTTLHLLSSATYLVPLALLIEDPFRTMPCPNLQTLSALIVLAIPGTAIAFIFYYKIVRHSGATTLSLVNYLLPIVKTALGVAILGETLNTSFCCAATLILFGLKLTHDASPIEASVASASSLS